MPRLMIWVLIAVTVLALYGLPDNKAMEECMKTHSYDTCHTTLNR